MKYQGKTRPPTETECGVSSSERNNSCHIEKLTPTGNVARKGGREGEIIRLGGVFHPCAKVKKKMMILNCMLLQNLAGPDFVSQSSFEATTARGSSRES